MPPPYDDPAHFLGCSRRTAIKQCMAGLVAVGTVNAPTTHMATAVAAPAKSETRPWMKSAASMVAFQKQSWIAGRLPPTLASTPSGVGSDGLKHKEIERYHQRGLKVFAEFNSMHVAPYLKEHPDAAPIGADGKNPRGLSIKRRWLR